MDARASILERYPPQAAHRVRIARFSEDGEDGSRARQFRGVTADHG